MISFSFYLKEQHWRLNSPDMNSPPVINLSDCSTCMSRSQTAIGLYRTERYGRKEVKINAMSAMIIIILKTLLFFLLKSISREVSNI
jgi:hypothetical protein